MPPTLPQRLFLIRHGQTDWNFQCRIQGHSDIPLNGAGREQARRAGLFLAGVPLTRVCTSRLLRARQTAEAVAAHHPHLPEPRVHADLAEIHLGDWEGLTAEDIDARMPGAYATWRSRPSEVIIPNAEPLGEFRVRVRGAFEALVSETGGGTCAVVTHGGVIAALLADFLGADFDSVLRRVRIDNAGVTAVAFEDGAPHVLWINATGHLEVSEEVLLYGSGRGHLQ